MFFCCSCSNGNCEAELLAHKVSETVEDPIGGLARVRGKVIGGREGDLTDLGWSLTTITSVFTTVIQTSVNPSAFDKDRPASFL